MTESRSGLCISLLLLALAATASLMPLVWMVSTSLKPQEEVTTSGISFLPEAPSKTWQYARENYYSGRPTITNEAGVDRVGYEGVLTSDNVHFLLFLRNTLIVAVLSVVGMVLSSSLCAYGFAKVRWRGRGAVFAVMLATMMIPFPAVMIPTYFIFKYLGWIGTLQPLWVPAWFGAAFNIFLLRQFFMQIPDELSEAATLDGLEHWGIFWLIVMPLSRPALAVVTLFHSMYVWNDFIAPLIYLNHQDLFTLALGLQFYQAQHGGTPWNLLMAACTLVTAPLIIVFVLTQRTFVEGIVTTGIKG